MKRMEEMNMLEFEGYVETGDGYRRGKNSMMDGSIHIGHMDVVSEIFDNFEVGEYVEVIIDGDSYKGVLHYELGYSEDEHTPVHADELLIGESDIISILEDLEDLEVEFLIKQTEVPTNKVVYNGETQKFKVKSSEDVEEELAYQPPIKITNVTKDDKKQFIRWFLDNYQLKRRESVWILNYLLNHDSFLDNIHFIKDARFTPLGVIITAHCSDEVPFRFYKENIVTTDSEKAFHHLRVNKKEDYYFQLNFSEKTHSQWKEKYFSVLEENPFLPDDHYITIEDKRIASQFCEAMEIRNEQESLMKKVDEALVNGDKDAFMQASAEYKALLEPYEGRAV